MSKTKLSLDDIIANETEIAQGRRKQYECMAECSDIFRERNKVSIEQCKYDAEYHEQLLEHLKELRRYREDNNKTIDDFTEKLKARSIKVSTVKNHTYLKAVGTNEIDKIALQMKEGGGNDEYDYLE